MIRYLQREDIENVLEIYNEYFSDMEFPEFICYPCVYVVTDDTTDRIIAVGGIKPLAEAVVLTDRSFSIRKRRNALLDIHTALTYSAEKLGFKQLHAFAFEDRYIDHLINRMNFKEIKSSRLLVLELKDGQEKRRTSTATNYFTH